MVHHHGRDYYSQGHRYDTFLTTTMHVNFVSGYRTGLEKPARMGEQFGRYNERRPQIRKCKTCWHTSQSKEQKSCPSYANFYGMYMLAY
jgi:hypothetical protein